jgi:ribosomal protein S18 acetylase RimI-like enzyme
LSRSGSPAPSRCAIAAELDGADEVVRGGSCSSATSAEYGPAVELALLDLCDQSTASELLELQRRAYRVEAELIGSFAIPALDETLAELQRCGETFLGAIVEGAIAGAISWRVVGDTIDLHRLIVDPAHFRRGIGSLLVRRALAVEPSVRDAVVQTGAANAPALALYRREGFSVVDEAEPAPGLRVVLLAKRLR